MAQTIQEELPSQLPHDEQEELKARLRTLLQRFRCDGELLQNVVSDSYKARTAAAAARRCNGCPAGMTQSYRDKRGYRIEGQHVPPPPFMAVKRTNDLYRKGASAAFRTPPRERPCRSRAVESLASPHSAFSNGRHQGRSASPCSGRSGRTWPAADAPAAPPPPSNEVVAQHRLAAVEAQLVEVKEELAKEVGLRLGLEAQVPVEAQNARNALKKCKDMEKQWEEREGAMKKLTAKVVDFKDRMRALRRVNRQLQREVDLRRDELECQEASKQQETRLGHLKDRAAVDAMKVFVTGKVVAAKQQEARYQAVVQDLEAQLRALIADRDLLISTLAAHGLLSLHGGNTVTATAPAIHPDATEFPASPPVHPQTFMNTSPTSPAAAEQTLMSQDLPPSLQIRVAQPRVVCQALHSPSSPPQHHLLQPHELTMEHVQAAALLPPPPPPQTQTADFFSSRHIKRSPSTWSSSSSSSSSDAEDPPPRGVRGRRGGGGLEEEENAPEPRPPLAQREVWGSGEQLQQEQPGPQERSEQQRSPSLLRPDASPVQGGHDAQAARRRFPSLSQLRRISSLDISVASAYRDHDSIDLDMDLSVDSRMQGRRRPRKSDVFPPGYIEGLISGAERRRSAGGGGSNGGGGGGGGGGGDGDGADRRGLVGELHGAEGKQRTAASKGNAANRRQRLRSDSAVSSSGDDAAMAPLSGVRRNMGSRRLSSKRSSNVDQPAYEGQGATQPIAADVVTATAAAYTAPVEGDGGVDHGADVTRQQRSLSTSTSKPETLGASTPDRPVQPELAGHPHQQQQEPHRQDSHDSVPELLPQYSGSERTHHSVPRQLSSRRSSTRLSEHARGPSDANGSYGARGGGTVVVGGGGDGDHGSPSSDGDGSEAERDGTSAREAMHAPRQSSDRSTVAAPFGPSSTHDSQGFATGGAAAVSADVDKSHGHSGAAPQSTVSMEPEHTDTTTTARRVRAVSVTRRRSSGPSLSSSSRRSSTQISSRRPTTDSSVLPPGYMDQFDLDTLESSSQTEVDGEEEEEEEDAETVDNADVQPAEEQRGRRWDELSDDDEESD